VKSDREALSKILLDLCERLAQDLARKGLRAGSLGIKLRFEDFQTVTRDQTLPAPIAEAEQLREAARACLKRVDLGRKLRLLGIRAGALVQSDQASSRITKSPEVTPPGLFDPMDLS